VTIHRDEKRLTVKLAAPAGTSGKVILPDGKTFEAGPGESAF